MLISPDKELVIRAENGDAEAIKELASLFHESDEEIDRRKAFMLYQKANEISRGDPIVVAQLASCYCDGVGTDKDTARGLQMFREAAESEDATVQYLFARQLKENNDPECIEWFEKVYSQGDLVAASAAYYIACIYRDGVIAAQDQSKYLEYSWKAVEAGNQDALRELSEMYLSSESEKIKESIPSLEKLAHAGSADAAKALANLYLNDEHVKKNIAKAFEWAGIAAKNGDPEFAYEFAYTIKDENLYDRLKCLESAAQKNHIKAICDVASIYEMFDEIKDTEKAKSYYIRALELNEPSAPLSLKNITGYSQGGKDEYREIIKASADHGSAAAALEMHNIYHEGDYIAQDERKAGEYLDKAIEAEYPPALCTLGSYYANGDFGYPKNSQMALSLWQKAAEGKNGTAAELIGNFYSDGISVSRDIDAAIEWYDRAIEYGNPRGYYDIGSIYEKAEFGRQDYDKALYYYTKGHECQNVSSTLALARKYEEGVGVEADPVKAFDFYKHAADHSFIKNIIVKVATLYLDGKGVEANPVMAVEYLERVHFLGDAEVNNLLSEARSKCTPEALLEHSIKKAEQGNHIAEYELYELYSGGKDIPQDSTKALEYLKKSADGGYGVALDKLGEIEIGKRNYILAAEYWENAIQVGCCLHIYTLACLYIEGNYGIQQNAQRGVELMRKAAELGNADAQNELGILYYKGDIVPQNYAEAFKWVQMSANANSALGQNNLGMFYKQGVGCVANPTTAAVWYEKASNQGNFNATVCYANMLYRGDGVAKQPKRMEMLFRRILDTKNLLNDDPELYKDILYNLASLYTDELNDPFTAFTLWKELAELGNPIAQYNLGVFCLNGTGTAKDREKAKAYFSRALIDGVKEAQKCLDLIKEEENIDEMKRRQQSVQEYAQRVQNRGCYVATAVYGSYDCPEVWVLRRFRDYKLSATRGGRAFIKFYYKTSPIYVKHFGKTKIFNRIFKGILDKMVNKLRAEGYEDMPYYDKE